MKKKFNAPGNKKYLPKKRLIIGIGVTVAIVAVAGGYYLSISRNADILGDRQAISQSMESEKKVGVLVISKKILEGNYIESTDYDVVEYLQEEIPEYAILDASELQGKVLRNDLEQGSVIRRNDLLHKMPYEEDDRFVEHNFMEGAIPTTIPVDQLIGTIVDINLFRAGARDEIVISKVTILAKDANKLAFYLDPVEKEYLKESATEGILYLTGYAEKNQKASEVTYKPGYLK